MNKTHLPIWVSALCIGAALTVMILSAPAQRWLTGFHGYQIEAQLEMPALHRDHSSLRLIVPVFNGCADSCPSNLMLAKRLLRQQSDVLRLVLMPVESEADLTTLALSLSNNATDKVDILGDTFSLSRDRLDRYEQIQTSSGQPPQHAGYLYLYQPDSQTLLTYTLPSMAAIQNDINKLKHGANDGDKHVQLVKK